ncbi:hypothetical protein ACFSSA_14620 [Luteolibacter algae]|uniref:Uncharacterized protein n=1 Tax=Luteolibacter algae TaxID=454151 RepID=A0ABW5DAA1_9BACT
MAGLIYNFKNQDQPSVDGAHARTMAEGTLADERISLLNEALPQCSKMLEGFFTAGAPESRNQFVYQPIENAAAMARFYALNPFPKVNLGKLRRQNQEMIHVNGEWMVLTRWNEDTPDGQTFDAIFRKEGEDWRLDWRHLSHYSDFPWVLFLAGEGPDVAEFRLLARKRLSQDPQNTNTGKFFITLAAPEFGYPMKVISESSEFVLKQNNPDGELLSTAFDSNLQSRKILGSSVDTLQAEGWLTVRVKVRRDTGSGIKSFHLEKLFACDWLN